MVADRSDVAGRLAEGRVAVEHTQSYVLACHALGYGHPDLTSHPSQIRDWYDSEEGLDLDVLDRDCAELRAAGAAVAEGLRMQRAQVAELAEAWTGPGGDSAVAFLQRHCDAADTISTEARAAAQRCESLRHNLWYLLDSKVATAIAIDDRSQAQRPVWLAAAAAVTTGAGDRPTAEEVVRQQLNPYVDNDIRNDWLTAMRSTLAGVAASYDMVTDRMAAAPAPCFEFPGDFGADCRSRPPAPPGMPEAPVAIPPPAALTGPPVDAPPAPTLPTGAPAQAPASPAMPDLGTALGDAAALPTGDLGGGLSGLSGLGGLASRIVDALGSLLGSGADQLGDPSALDSFDQDPFHAGDEHLDADDKSDDDRSDDADKHDAAEDEPKGADESDAQPEEGDATEEGKAGEAAPPVDVPPPADGPPPIEGPAPAGAPAPVAAPPTGGPLPPANEGSTPCQIAADQLPQAGQ